MVTEIPVPVEWPARAEEYPPGVFDTVTRSFTDLLSQIEESIKSFVEYVIQLIKRLVESLVRSTSEIKVTLIGLAIKTSGFLSGTKERTVGLLNNIADLSTRSLTMVKEHLKLFVRRLIRLIKPEEVELPREVAVEAPIPVEPELFPELEERPSIFDTVARPFTGLSYKIEEGIKSFVEYLIQLIRYLIECTGRLAERIAELSVELASKAREGIDQFLSKVREGTPILAAKVAEFLNNTTEALARLTDNIEENVKLLAGYLSRLITHLIECIIRLVKRIASLLKREGRVEYVKLPEVEVTEVGEGVVELEIKPSEPVTMGGRVSDSVKKVVESLVRLMNRGKECIRRVLMKRE